MISCGRCEQMVEETQKPTLLIADDIPANINILGELLRTEYVIRVATSGNAALAIAFSKNPPDLILLDIMMPGMDGLEVCRILKNDPRTQNIPVIFITAKCSEEDEIQGFRAGAVDFITKPFSSVVVKARVETHTELKRYRDFLENTSYCDGLTTIANRRRFDQYLEMTWNSCLDRDSSTISLIMIDVDHFKAYNDHYGHPEGDCCLKQIAQTLSKAVKRKSDLIARYGGEEFVCLLPGTEKNGALLLAEIFKQRILSLQITHPSSPSSHQVTISAGVTSMVPSRDASALTLVRLADQALYLSKQNGRNRITYLGPESVHLPSLMPPHEDILA